MPLTWTEYYNIHRASVGSIGDIVVSYSHGGYAVSAFGRRLKHHAADLDEGKERGIALARKLLAEAAADINA